MIISTFCFLNIISLGVVRSLVTRSVFKTDGGRIPSPVGSIPICSRHKQKGSTMLQSKQHKAFCNFYDAVRDESNLDKRTTILVGLATAMAIGCEP